MWSDEQHQMFDRCRAELRHVMDFGRTVPTQDTAIRIATQMRLLFTAHEGPLVDRCWALLGLKATPMITAPTARLLHPTKNISANVSTVRLDGMTMHFMELRKAALAKYGREKPLIEREEAKSMPLAAYLHSTGLIVHGETVKRRELISLYANTHAAHVGPPNKYLERVHGLMVPSPFEVAGIPVGLVELAGIAQHVAASEDLKQLADLCEEAGRHPTLL